ncbi:uncharacterized protein [Typha latifolia]|uniref:uncharacterized protein n=1 Tax=Typha latifolia TaxID=4733 RepID=UPI003C2E264F
MWFYGGYRNMTTAQNRMKQVYDRRHRELEFEVGGLVFVRAQPYRQGSLHLVCNPKLERVGPVAYRLELLEGSQVHPMFHVLLLWARVRADQAVSTQIPDPVEEIDGYKPVRVLERWRRHQEGRLETKILMEWLGRHSDEAKWEFEEDITECFLDFTP